jgi:hypothetical protein
MTRKPKFEVGDLVEDTETGQHGTIVHVYDDPEIRDDIIAVQFEGDDVPLAVPIDTIRQPKTAPVDKRRKGGK